MGKKKTALNQPKKKKAKTILEEDTSKQEEETPSVLKTKKKRKAAPSEELEQEGSEEEEQELKIASVSKKSKKAKKAKPNALKPEKEEVEEEEESKFAPVSKKSKRAKTSGLETHKKADKEEEIVEETGALGTAPKKANALTAKGKPSHSDLNKRAADVGRRLRAKLEEEVEAEIESADLASKIEEISKLTDVETGFFESRFDAEYLEEYEFEGTDKTFRQFKNNYRDWANEMDEFVSTSTVRELLRGMLEGDAPSEAVRGRIGELVDLMSVVRAPTGYMGFAVKKTLPKTTTPEIFSMQHIAPEENQMFADAKKTGTEHDELDSKRKDSVLKAMEDALEDGAAAEGVVVAGVLQALKFTLNFFMSSATADNVSPNMMEGVSDDRKKEQANYRETKVKPIVEILGGELETPEEDEFERIWLGPDPTTTGKSSELFKLDMTRGFSILRTGEPPL